MTKVINNKKTYSIFCPGCKCTHNINCNPDNFGPWKFEGTSNKPTFKSSCKINYHGKDGEILSTCHFQINDGEIEFLNDTTHHLKGKKITLPDIKI